MVDENDRLNGKGPPLPSDPFADAYVANHGPALFGAIVGVLNDLKGVKKTGKNTFHKYVYASDYDLLKTMNPLMATHGLCMLPVRVQHSYTEIPDRKGTTYRCDVHVKYMLAHSSGEFTYVEAVGSGVDGQDKGAYKAMTGANKYALRLTFQIPTGDDPELEQAKPKATKQVKKETPKQAEERKSTHDIGWENGAREKFFAQLKEGGVAMSYDDINTLCESKGKPRPSQMDASTRTKLVKFLISNHGESNVSQ